VAWTPLASPDWLATLEMLRDEASGASLGILIGTHAQTGEKLSVLVLGHIEEDGPRRLSAPRRHSRRVPASRFDRSSRQRLPAPCSCPGNRPSARPRITQAMRVATAAATKKGNRHEAHDR
jgi:hypothetical protein